MSELLKAWRGGKRGKFRRIDGGKLKFIRSDGVIEKEAPDPSVEAAVCACKSDKLCKCGNVSKDASTCDCTHEGVCKDDVECDCGCTDRATCSHRADAVEKAEPTCDCTHEGVCKDDQSCGCDCEDRASCTHSSKVDLDELITKMELRVSAG